MSYLQRAISALLILGCSLGPRLVHAAAPSVNECLAASDDSLKSNATHKLRAEREQLLICASESCPREIREECLRRVEQANQAVPTIVFEVKDRSGADVTNVKVTMDHEVLAERLDGMAIAVDPGEHRFVFQIAGEPPLERRLIIPMAQKNRHELISFAKTSSTGTNTSGPRTSEPPEDERSQKLSQQRLFGIVSAGVGVVGIGVGTAFGLIAKSRKSDAEQVCPGERYCENQSGVDRWNDAKTAGGIATVGFIVGGLGLAGAAVLWFTDNPKAPEQPRVGLGPGGLVVRGKW